jgi:hypothetical protein
MNPEEYLKTANFVFSESEIRKIVKQFVLIKTGFQDVPFSLDYDEEDYQARLYFDPDDLDEDEDVADRIQTALEHALHASLDDDYEHLRIIMSNYMNVSVNSVMSYYGSGGLHGRNYWVEVPAKDYVQYINIHQWGVK